MRKVILQEDQGMLYDINGGVLVGTCVNSAQYIIFDDPANSSDLTLQLIKQGVTVDEIIKLKNNELI